MWTHAFSPVRLFKLLLASLCVNPIKHQNSWNVRKFKKHIGQNHCTGTNLLHLIFCRMLGNLDMSRMYESCHIYEWVMSHVMSHGALLTSYLHHDKTQCPPKRWWRYNNIVNTWMSHVTYEWVMPRKNESCHIWMSHGTEILMVVQQYSEYNIFSGWDDGVRSLWCGHDRNCGKWVMSHTNKSCHIRMSHATCMNESCHIWMSHATYEWGVSHMNELWHWNIDGGTTIYQYSILSGWDAGVRSLWRDHERNCGK